MNDTNLATITDFRSVSTDTLKQELARSMDITVRHIQYLAQIWGELENRGVDLSELRNGIMVYLPLIANNKVDARLIVNYAGQKTLLSALSRLPIDKQASLIDVGYVDIVKIGESGEKIESKVQISRLTASDVYQVFGESVVRSTNEQYLLLAAKEKAKAKAKKTYRSSKKVKIEDGFLVISHSAANISQVLSVLSSHYGIKLESIITDHRNKIVK